MTRRFNILVPHHQPETPGLWCWRDDWQAPGQSAFALLAKFQRLNALSCTAIADYFGHREGRRSVPRDIDLRDVRQFDVRRLTDVLRLPLEDIARAFTMPSHLAGVIAAPTLRWCERCAREGMHLTAFQMRARRLCPVHHTALEDRCPRCGLEIPFRLRPDVFRTPFACPSCATPWIAPLRDLDDLRVDDAYRRVLSRWIASTVLNGPPVARRRRSRRAIAQDDPQPAPADDAWNVCRADEQSEPQYAQWTQPPDTTVRGDELLSRARSCYKAIRRQIMRRYGGQHHGCIVSAARHLCWRMDGRSTTPFCSIALAVLRWRTKWEGFGVPQALLHAPLHAPLGIVIWLSRYAPVPRDEWSESTSQWFTLHLFAIACIDSFYTFLREAQQARRHERIVWWPFPSDDFPRRELIVRGRDRPDDPARFRLTSFETGQGGGAAPTRVPGGLVHRKQHVQLLVSNRMPRDASGLSPPSGSAPYAKPTTPAGDDNERLVVTQQNDAGPTFANANVVGTHFT
ncbi:hypothetical protein [Paraburkholderia sp.]|uniref:hypothetical protein n=1 Tax=Paraburkholderia sp. TaxID=1926495 RepID=UPI003C7BE7DD